MFRLSYNVGAHGNGFLPSIQMLPSIFWGLIWGNINPASATEIEIASSSLANLLCDETEFTFALFRALGNKDKTIKNLRKEVSSNGSKIR